MKKIQLLSWFFLFFIPQLFFAQSLEDGNLSITQSVTAASPTVAALEEYATIPVSKHTGIPNISIPLGAVQGKSISVPIQMSYHAGGIKVSDYGSWVGLGWSIHGGGIISRTVNGLPDEDWDGYWNTNNPIPLLSSLDNNPTPSSLLGTYYQRLINGLEDSEPDLFTLMFAEGSATFMINKQGEIVFFPYKNLKINLVRSTNNKITSFEVTAPSGNRYIFGGIERTAVSSPSGQNPQSYTSSWALTEVIAPNGTERIQLTYVDESYTMSSSKTFTDYYRLGSYTCLTTPSSTTIISNTDIIGAKRLSKIENLVTGDKVEFIAKATSRTDLPGMHQLEKVKVYQKSQLVKSWELGYQTFSGVGARPKLATLTEKGINAATAKPPYLFEYESGDLPSVDNLGIDHWGYYTGRTNFTVLPSVHIPYGNGNLISIAGANRAADDSPNAIYMKRGTLKKINYPLGGHTQFEYEPNDYGVEAHNGPVNEAYLEQKSAQSWCEGCIISPATNFSTNYASESDHHSAKLVYNFSCGACSNGSIPMEQPTFYLKEDGVIIYSRTAQNYPETGEYWFDMDTTKTYTLITESLGGQGLAGRVSVSVNYFKLAAVQPGAPVVNKSKRAGGLRIKSITKHDGSDSQKDIVRNFEYVMANEPDRSSGHLLINPRYDHYYNQLTAVQLTTGTGQGNYTTNAVCPYIRRSATQTIRATSSGAGHIYYKEVVEKLGNGIQGYTLSKYKDYSVATTTNRHPFPQQKPDGYKQGLLEAIHVYNASNQLLKKIENQYSESVVKNSIIDFKVGILEGGSNPTFNTFYQYEWREFESRPFYLSETITTSYDENGQQPQTQIVRYTYNDDHLNPIKVETELSDGVTYITKAKYPSDYTSSTIDAASTAIKNLKDQYRHNILIESTQWKQKPASSPQLIGGSVSTFRTLSSGLVVPKAVYSTQLTTPTTNYTPSSVGVGGFVMDNNYELRETYTGYDLYGNILGVQSPFDQGSSIAWGYDQQLPIISAINANPLEIAYTSFEEGDETGWNISQNSTRVTGKIGRSAMRTTEDFSFGRVFNVEEQEKKYKFSAWVKTSDATNSYLVLRTCDANGNTYPNPNTAPSYVQQSFTTTNGKWQLVEVELDLQAIRQAAGLPLSQNLEVHAYLWNPHLKTIDLDAVRFHPSNAFVQTYDYDPNTRQVIAMEKMNRLHRSFYYDDFQRLSYIKDFEENIIATTDYHYKGSGSTENYVKTQGVRVTGKTNLADLAGLGLHQLTETYQYLDGLGRPIQNVHKGQSPKQKDMVAFQEFDSYGRQPKSYLPFASNTNNTGIFNTNPIQQLQTFYTSTIATESQTIHPFNETIFEASPFSRSKEQSSVGDGWQIGNNHTVKSIYQHNAANEVLFLDNQSTSAQYYPANTLVKQEIINEKGVKSIYFADQFGRVVLTKQEISSSTWTNSYSLYDDFNNLKAVITPLAVNIMQQHGNYNYTDPMYKELIYAYTYDARQRMTSKKIPNAGVLYYVYDKLDRIVATQDANQRPLNQWSIQKYDQYSRQILSALYYTSASHTAFQQYYDAEMTLYEDRAANAVGYTNKILILPNNSLIQTINYYDDYDFDRDGQIDANNAFLLSNGYSITYFDRILSQPTGSKVRVLDGSNRFLKQIYYYDKRGRVIQSQQENHLSGKDNTFSAYDFIGNVIKARYQHTTHQTGHISNEVITEEFYKYDHAGRLLEVYHKAGTQDKVLLKQHNYDELGRLIEKNLHSTNNGANFLQSVDYHYNAKNWLVRINDLEQASPHSTTGTNGNSGTAILGKKLNEIILKYNEADIRDGELETEVEIDDETVDLVNGIIVASQLAQTNVDLQGNVTTATKDEEVRVDFSDQTIDENNISVSLEELKTRLQQKLTANGVSNPTVMEVLLKELTAEYRDRWLLMRSNAQNEDNKDLLKMNFAYDYGGNINHLEWNVESYNYRSMYDYSYDNLNRLVNANYAEYMESSTPVLPVYQRQNHFSVNNISYDIMGNIMGLQRKGTVAVSGTTLTNGMIDDLTYRYANNQLKRIDETAHTTIGFHDQITAPKTAEYVYDLNGNQIEDKNKQITIQYNHLNLPKQVQFAAANASINWTYNASGRKLQKQITDAGGVVTNKHYIGGVQYLNTDIEFIHHSEGRIIRNLIGYDVHSNPIYDYRYEYSLRDHLGNERIFFSDMDKDGIVEVSQTGGQNEVLQQEHYYPFGMGIRGEWKFVQPQIGGTNRYQFNGIELNDDFGLDWNMAMFRTYDPSIGRWGQVDPLTEMFSTVSSYNGMGNNPVMFSDQLGLAPNYHAEPAKGVEPAKKKKIKSRKPPDRWAYYPDANGGEGDLIWVSNEGGDQYDIVETHTNPLVSTSNTMSEQWYYRMNGTAARERDQRGRPLKGFWESQYNTPTELPSGGLENTYPIVELLTLGAGKAAVSAGKAAVSGGKAALKLTGKAASRVTGVSIKKQSGITITRKLAQADKPLWQISLFTRTTHTEGVAMYHYKNFTTKYEFGIHYHNLPVIKDHYIRQGFTGIDQKFLHYHVGVGKRAKKHYQMFKNGGIYSDQMIMHSGAELRKSWFGFYY